MFDAQGSYADLDAELLELTAEKGQGLYRVAWDLDTLVQELGTVVGDIVNRISSGAAVAVVSTETGTDDRLYRGKFLPGAWKGYLEAFDLPYHNGDSPVWEAGRILRDQAPYDRTLFTSLRVHDQQRRRPRSVHRPGRSGFGCRAERRLRRRLRR